MNELEDRKRSIVSDAVRNATLSGMGTGAFLGGLSRVMAGQRSLPAILKAMAGTSAISGATAGGATALGTQLMGDVQPDETNPYTRRAGLGGAIGGGLAGAGMGALLASGALRKLSPGLLKMFRDGPGDNIIGDKFMALGAKPTPAKTLLGTALGGASGGTLAAYLAADEGMGIDVLQAELEEAKLRRARERGML